MMAAGCFGISESCDRSGMHFRECVLYTKISDFAACRQLWRELSCPTPVFKEGLLSTDLERSLIPVSESNMAVRQLRRASAHMGATGMRTSSNK
jgi:hypothetical protein